MSWSSSSSSTSSSMLHGVINNSNTNKLKLKLKGVRRRKWGKWVSEIRVPGTQERLWLGTYSTAEAAAVAHDVAVYCLRKPSSLDKLNFPETLSSYGVIQQHRDHVLSPKSVQKVASDVGMDVDARNIATGTSASTVVEETTNHDYDERKEKKKSDDHHYNDDSDLLWWESLGDDSQGSEEECREGEALSISVEDYL
ncbi:hypothetical protein RIF29_37530 [Crotalaria pallida]|uniref:AP2/ERF domain-containing protein n=1 Tax=Crotalaria pallida TaxID=3830 RepID=A0AAN9EDC5_CROPI